MPIIEPLVARFVVVGALNGQDCMNVLDAEINTLDSAKPRDEACYDLAGDLLNNWTDHVLNIVSVNYVAREVRWVDLNSETGSTGARSSTSAESWPQAGTTTGSMTPNNTCAVMKKNLQGAGRTTRSGAVRVGGIPETATLPDGVTLTNDYIGWLNDGFEQIKDGINGVHPGPTAWESNLCQVHTRNGVATGHSIISTFSCHSTVGTQRRRMPGYGT